MGRSLVWRKFLYYSLYIFPAYVSQPFPHHCFYLMYLMVCAQKRFSKLAGKKKQTKNWIIILKHRDVFHTVLYRAVVAQGVERVILLIRGWQARYWTQNCSRWLFHWCECWVDVWVTEHKKKIKQKNWIALVRMCLNKRSWWPGWHLAWQPPPSVDECECEWVNVMSVVKSCERSEDWKSDQEIKVHLPFTSQAISKCKTSSNLLIVQTVSVNLPCL